ncbi:MAG: shikimate kinase [Novosphingobium sp.]
MDHDHDLHPSAEIAALARRIDRPIVLVGMMGVGKTTVGRKLAQLLDVPFVDADEAIEQAAHMTIPEIFATYGEPYFRDGERRVIARLIADETGHGTAKIIATGGGAFCSEVTRKLVLEKAIGVWLDADVEVLLERVRRKNNRPLLQQGDPRETLTRLRNERRDFYAEAPIHITSCNAPHARTALEILKEVDAWL